MPIFEYRCHACGAEFEALLKRREEEVCCPECGTKELERKFSAFAVAEKAPGCAAKADCPSAHQCGGGGCCCH